jgi:hypothetical protein
MMKMLEKYMSTLVTIPAVVLTYDALAGGGMEL